MQTVKMINYILMCLFFACYMYQFLYIPVSWLPRKRQKQEAPLHRFAILIAACNEEAVIGNLLDSIAAQSYPERFLKVFVVADNCRDKTAVGIHLPFLQCLMIWLLPPRQSCPPGQ